MQNILALAAEALAAIDRFHRMWDQIAAVRAVYEAALGTQGDLAEKAKEGGPTETGPEVLRDRNADLEELEREVRAATNSTTRDQQHAVAMLVVLVEIQTNPLHPDSWAELKQALKAVRGKGPFLWRSHYEAVMLHPMMGDLAVAIGNVLELCTEDEADGGAMEAARARFYEVCEEGEFNQCDPAFGSATWLAAYELTQRVEGWEEVQRYLSSHVHH